MKSFYAQYNGKILATCQARDEKSAAKKLGKLLGGNRAAGFIHREGNGIYRAAERSTRYNGTSLGAAFSVREEK